MLKKRAAIYGSIVTAVLSVGLVPSSVCGCLVKAPMVFAHVMKSDPMREDLAVLQDKVELWVPVGSPTSYIDEFLAAVSQRERSLKTCDRVGDARICRLWMTRAIFYSAGVEVRFDLDSEKRVTDVQVNRYRMWSL